MFVRLPVPAYGLCRCLKLFFVGRPVRQIQEVMNASLGPIIFGSEMENKSAQSLVVIGFSPIAASWQLSRETCDNQRAQLLVVISGKCGQLQMAFGPGKRGVCPLC